MKYCPCCGGPYDHSEAMCQGVYEDNWEPEDLEPCDNGTCIMANGGCDCGGEVEARFYGEI